MGFAVLTVFSLYVNLYAVPPLVVEYHFLSLGQPDHNVA